MQAEIPEDVLEFIARRIDSVPHLEALLLMREKSDESWTQDVISHRVYVSRDQAGAILQDLARHGFITPAERPDCFRYEPSWDQAQIMAKVAATYRQHLVQTAELIHSKAGLGAVKEFARAFKFKNKE